MPYLSLAALLAFPLVAAIQEPGWGRVVLKKNCGAHADPERQLPAFTSAPVVSHVRVSCR